VPTTSTSTPSGSGGGSGGGSGTNNKPINTPPTANAGDDRKIKLGTIITLDGERSYDAEGNPLQYLWRVIEGPETYILQNETTATPTFKASEVGIYVIGLKVFDGTFDSEEDSVIITVETNSSGTIGGGTTTTSTVPNSSTTTTSAPATTSSSTTTILSIKVWCPLFFLTDNDIEKITLLRDFRDNVLLKTPMGKEYVKLFYRNATELISIFMNNREITNQAKTALEEILPNVKLVIEGKVITISPILLSAIEGMLDQISLEAGVELRQEIERLQEDLREGKIFDELGMKISLQN
jgi:hypothetical protein